MMYRVDSAESAQAAIGKAQPGDEIVVADGVYSDWEVMVSCAGTEDAPIVIRAENRNGVKLVDESSFHVPGSYVVIEGFRFEDCRMLESCVLFDGATGCRVTNCEFEGAFGRAPVVMVRGRTVDVRVDHCKFVKPEARSVQIAVRGERSPMRTRIDHNLFQDVPPIPSGNGRETIQVGQAQPRWGWFCPLTIVEHNTFLRCDGEIEIISNKSSRNTYRYNLFKDCKGELVMRGGSHCEIIGNRFENCTGGVRLSGTHHRVMNNVIVDCQVGMKLRYGMKKELGGHYQAVTQCLIANNTIANSKAVGLQVGAGKGTDAGEKGIASIAPYENQIAKNIVFGATNELIQIVDAPDNMIESNVLWNTSGDTPKLDKNKTGDPMFVDAEAGDYRLNPDSSYVGIGASGDSIETGPDV